MAETTKNFIYLLPDVAYVVELMKSKDSEVFKVSDYLQINGNFIDENDILEESIKKLVNRIKPKTYDLVLPDFLFTNTMVNVNETGEEKVMDHVNSRIIPDLGISDKTHELKVFILNEFKGHARVQFSALEKTVLKPLRTVFPEDGELKITNVFPLSWITKSLIALEPSISVVQMGTKLYMAQHYIGIDQANDSTVDDVEKIVESIKTLKGAEPSIQTVYLLANALVEGKLEESLKGTLPVQQLAKESEESEMPSYIKQVVEAAVKSIEIKEYQIPGFSFAGIASDALEITEELEETKEDEDDGEIEIEDKKEPAVLPPPMELGTTVAEDNDLAKTEEIEEELEEVAKTNLDVSEKEAEEVAEAEEPKEEIITKAIEEESEKMLEKNKTESTPVDKKENESTAEIDLRQFMSEDVDDNKKEEVKKTEVIDKPVMAADKADKKIIKNDSGINNMVKMVFVALVSFFITVGIGLGIGLGFLTFTNKQQTANEPPVSPVAEVSPTVEPTIEPTFAPVNREEFSVLVVNATTKAGYAGEIASLLEEAGFKDVAAANAKGDYKEGNFVLAEEENTVFTKTIEKDSDLTFEFLSEKEVEDPTDKYDFVVVLGE